MPDKEEIKRIIDEMSAENMLVITEGKKDEEALNKLGITNILTLSRKPLFAIAEEAAKNEEVAILTDLDAKGKELYGKLSKDLQRKGVRINNKLRHLLIKAKLSHIEGLNTFLE